MTNTIPNVPRELLERTIDRLKYGHEHDNALRELRAILATAKSAAADDERMRFDLRAEQQGWPKDHTMLHELWLAWKAGALKYAQSPAGVDGLGNTAKLLLPALRQYMHNDGSGLLAGYDLETTQAIIDGLRGEVADLRSMLATVSQAGIRVRTERDQQAQRIGELASHLEFAVTLLTVAGLAGNAQVEAMRAALSAGKDSDQ